MDDPRLHPGCPRALLEGPEHLRVVIREAPRPRALDEELERVGADCLRALRRGLHAAADMAAEEHAPTIVT